MNVLKKIRRILGSMPFAVTVLVLLALACALASMVPQGESLEWYTEQSGERTAALILVLGADDAYHSIWFIVLSGFLCLSLAICNGTRVRSLVRRTRETPADWAGIWGAWTCHLGILLLIIGFALGQMFQEDYSLYGLPGQTKELEGTGLRVTVEDFAIDWREDGSAGQYTAELSVTNPEGRTERGTASVNHPAEMFGYEFFQNSAGWAAEMTVSKEGEVLQRETLCVQEFAPLTEDPDIVVMLYGFYPNYDGSTGAAAPMASTRPERPGYVYMVFYRGEIRGMNVLQEGEEITIDGEYRVTFGNPTNYTVLMIRRDRFTWIALCGAALTLAGLVMAFYLKKR